ncbi:MAG: preprotein translocase subunit SecE [bacterium]
MKRLIKFLKEVRIELAKVSWPRREELWESTLIVIVVSLIMAVFIGVVDLLLSRGVGLLMK